MLKKNLLFLLSIYFTLTSNVLSDQKKKIIDHISNLNTLEFTFKQEINDKIEEGDCLLKFPGKLKCNYYDSKEKELVINNRRLAITQKRYDKTYFYPISKSPFLNILYKEKLLEIVKSGKLQKKNNHLQLIYNFQNSITVLFDENNFELKGWKILDQYNNRIVFNLKIIAKNADLSEDVFELPLIN